MTARRARRKDTEPNAAGLHVQLAGDLDTHCRSLLETVTSERQTPEAALQSLFSPPQIVVPNSVVGEYVRRRLACSELDCSFGTKIVTLSDFLEGADTPNPLWHRNMLRTAMLSVFFTPPLRAKLPSEVTSYLDSAPPGIKYPEIRAYQLADRLASIFISYDQERPEILEDWSNNTPTATATSASIEGWQRQLWLLMLETGIMSTPVPQEKGTEKQGLKNVNRKQQESSPSSEPRKEQQRIHMLGFSVLPEKTITMLQSIANTRRIDLYLTLTRSTPLVAPVANDPIPLWIAPQLATLATLKRDLTEAAIRITDTSDQRAQDTNWLKNVQSFIRTGKPTASRLSTPLDASLQFHACPGIKREAEVIANEVMRLVVADEMVQQASGNALTFSDIAIYIADRDNLDRYTAAISSVFFENHDIPVSIAGLNTGHGSDLIDGVTSLLELLTSGFTRSSVEAFLTNPAVCRRFRLSQDLCTKFCNTAGIFHGADHADHEHTYIQEDIYNWDQGIKRMVLGHWAPQTNDGNVPELEANGHIYRALQQRNDVSDEASLLLPVRALLNDAKALSQIRTGDGKNPMLREWGELFNRLVTTYMTAAIDEPKFLRAISEALLDLEGAPQGKHCVHVPLAVATQVAKAQVSALHRKSSFRSTNGIYVGPLRPGMAIPYRAVFVCGLSSGHFPTKEIHSELDIRDEAKVILTTRALGLSAFTEQLLAARDHLVLSYSSMSETLESSQSPSPALQQLNLLAESLFLDDSLHGVDLFTRHPVHPFDSSYSPVTRENKAMHIQDKLITFSPATLRLLNPIDEDSKPVQGLPEHPGPITADLVPKSLKITDLRDFLCCPMQGWSRHVLGMRKEWDNGPKSGSIDYAPFFLDLMSRSTVMKEVIEEVLLTHKDAAPPTEDIVNTVLDRVLRSQSREAKLPSGYFLDFVRERLHNLVHKIRATVTEQLDPTPNFGDFCRMRFAQGSNKPNSLVTLPAVHISLLPHPTLASRSVDIFGDTLVYCEQDKAFYNFVTSIQNKYFVEGYLSYLCFVASAEDDKQYRDHKILIIGEKDVRQSLLPPITANVAKGRLQVILSEMIYGTHDYQLTIENIVKNDRTPREINKTLEANQYPESSPIWRHDGYRFLTAEAIDRLVERIYCDILPIIVNAK